MSAARTARRSGRGAPRDDRHPSTRFRSNVSPEPARREAEDDEDAEEALAQYPPVVAVVVTRNPGPWFEDTLVSIGGAGLRRPPVLVVDCGSEDDPTARVAERAAAGVRAPARQDAPGFAEAANEALHVVEGATFLLSATTTSCSTRTRAARSWRRRTGRTPASSGPKLVSADEPRRAARGGPVDRPLRRAVHRHRARRVRPGAARRRPRRLLRPDRGDARARRPLHGARRLRPRDVPRRRRPRPVLAGAPRRCTRARRPRRARRRIARRPRTDGLRDDHPDEFGFGTQSRVRVLLHVVLVPQAVVAGARRVRGGLRRGAGRSADRPAAPRARAAIGSWYSNLFHVRQLPRVAQAGAGAAHRARLRTPRAAGVEHGAARVRSSHHHLHTDTRLRSIGDASRRRGRLGVRRHAHTGRRSPSSASW